MKLLTRKVSFGVNAQVEACFYFGVIISAVKRFIYLIAINRINVIVNSRLIAINRKLFFYAKYRLIFLSHNSSHFNYNMVNCIGLPCANDFFIDNNIGIY